MEDPCTQAQPTDSSSNGEPLSGSAVTKSLSNPAAIADPTNQPDSPAPSSPSPQPSAPSSDPKVILNGGQQPTPPQEQKENSDPDNSQLDHDNTSEIDDTTTGSKDMDDVDASGALEPDYVNVNADNSPNQHHEQDMEADMEDDDDPTYDDEEEDDDETKPSAQTSSSDGSVIINDKEELQEQLASFKAQLDESQARLGAQHEAHAAVVAELTQQLDSASQSVDTLTQENEAKAELLEAEQTRYSQLASEQSQRREQARQSAQKLQSRIKVLEKERKDMSRKHNETKAEMVRLTQSVDKVKRDAELDVELSQKRLEKAQNEAAALTQKLEKQQSLLEQERKEKASVADKNQDYLRNEKAKIAKQLNREKVTIRSLETQLNEMTKLYNTASARAAAHDDRVKACEAKERKAEAALAKATQDRDAARQKTIERNRQQRVAEKALTDRIESLERDVTSHENQTIEINRLEECLRKKTEKEETLEKTKRKLDAKERKLGGREKDLARRERQHRKTLDWNERQKGGNSSSKSWKKELESRDPLAMYRDLLPFHWISVVLFVVLMLAVAKK